MMRSWSSSIPDTFIIANSTRMVSRGPESNSTRMASPDPEARMASPDPESNSTQMASPDPEARMASPDPEAVPPQLSPSAPLPSSSSTATGSRKRHIQNGDNFATRTSRSSTRKKAKLEEPKDETCPVLTAEEQVAADSAENYEAGARVFALWNSEYLAANVCGVDSTNYRIKICYFVDKVIKLVPEDGILPIKLIKNGVTVTAYEDDGGDAGSAREINAGKITSIPSFHDADEWQNALYEVDREKWVPWSDILLTKSQFRALKNKKSK